MKVRCLHHLVVWRQVDPYSDAEQAVLVWAEALTTRGEGADLGALHGALGPYFSSDEIDLLMLVVVMTNTWNRLQIANHNATF